MLVCAGACRTPAGGTPLRRRSTRTRRRQWGSSGHQGPLLRRYPCKPCSSAAQKNTPQTRCALAAGTLTLGSLVAVGRCCFCASISKHQCSQTTRPATIGIPSSHYEQALLKPHLTACWHLIHISHAHRYPPLCQGHDRPCRRPHAFASWIDAQQCSHVPTRRLPDGIQPGPASYKSPQGEVIHARHAPALLFCGRAAAATTLGLQARLVGLQEADDARGRVGGAGPNPNLSPNPEIASGQHVIDGLTFKQLDSKRPWKSGIVYQHSFYSPSLTCV